VVRKLILKLQEDWAYKEEYSEAERRLESLAWATLQRWEMEGEGKKDKVERHL